MPEPVVAEPHAQSKRTPNVVLGAMTFGPEGVEGARIHNIDDVKAVLDVFKKYGHTLIDTAAAYTARNSEKWLGEIGMPDQGLEVSTKIHPNDTIKHTPEIIREQLEQSLSLLKVDQVDIYYLHAPDRSTPYIDTLRAMNDLFQEGKFKRFGISNYPSWEVGEIVAICELNGWVKPTVYQGLYNAIHRAVEPELFPALRKHNIAFYAYNPLGGGFFTGRYSGPNAATEAGSRFDISKGTNQSRNYRKRYWNDSYFGALELVKGAAEKHQLTMVEVALRWLMHHSELKREHNDGIIFGASSLKHMEENLSDLQKGPLPETMLDALDAAWKSVNSRDIVYYR